MNIFQFRMTNKSGGKDIGVIFYTHPGTQSIEGPIKLIIITAPASGNLYSVCKVKNYLHVEKFTEALASFKTDIFLAKFI